MGCQPDESVVLLAIKPKFSAAILAGHKTVEFRKTPFSKPPIAMVLYESFPTQRIVAHCQVSFIDEGTPHALWRRYRSVGSIEYAEFTEYYHASPTGIAIGLKDVATLDEPIPLSALGNGDRPPQSFAYVSFDALRRLRQRNAGEARGSG